MAMKKGVAKLLVTARGRTWEWPKGKVKNQKGAFVFIAGRNRRANPDIKDIEGRRFHAAEHSPIIDDDGNRVASWSVPSASANLIRTVVEGYYPATEIDWDRFDKAARRRPRAIPESPKPAPKPARVAPRTPAAVATPEPETGDPADVRVIDGGPYTLLRLPPGRATNNFIAALRQEIRRVSGYVGHEVPSYSKSLQVWKVRNRHEELATDLLPTYFPGFTVRESVAS